MTQPTSTPFPGPALSAPEAANPAAGADGTAPAFAARAAPNNRLRAAIAAACRRPEAQALAPLLEQARLAPPLADAVQQLALRLAAGLRERSGAGARASIVQGLLQEFSLSSQEGVALMCLAEALLRIPDRATRDALIRDKISAGQWDAHLGRSPSLFVNAATWGLLITGKLVATHSQGQLGTALARLVARGGEPLIRKSVDMGMRMLGEQFVAGQTIAAALARARASQARGFRHSWDMLGEAALTAADAARYCATYEQAIHAIGRAGAGRGVYQGPGISIKLSALHPRYCRAQWDAVQTDLYPRLRQLALLARGYDMGLNIDAEEADRLELSLDLLERLCQEPDLARWDGIGFVLQAYQKRCPEVVDYLIDLARRTQRRLMLRLVKGAYWDSEIKRAQLDGLDDYPVYTRKAHTDVSYLACARRLLAAPDAIYPQFATHNAQTLASIYQMAGPDWHAGQYEFQCLHGMGEALYEQVVRAPEAGGLGRPCRIYAPVGTHETLLPYLVRRLLENGANTSFVNRIADPALSLTELVRSPVQQVQSNGAAEGTPGLPHPRIPAPPALYGAGRANSRGLDLADETTLQHLGAALQQAAAQPWTAQPTRALDSDTDTADTAATTSAVRNPADRRDIVGQVQAASPADVDRALHCAQQAAPQWAATAPAERAAMLLRAADLIQNDAPLLIGLLVREAGKTCANALAEVRETVDFLRYYATQIVACGWDNATHLPLGPVACISPWNFPLAIFTGQLAAALAAGNPVLAKPAEQTPLIAAAALRLLWRAGVPRAALQLLPGPGRSVGARLAADARVQGLLFTGSTQVARLLQRSLAGRLGPNGRPVPLIAETGGQNAMIVDTSALPEQVVADVLASAFDSAGQRCSALRVLCLQQEGAERLLQMLRGAMAELRIGNPALLASDIGPVIDAAAQAAIEQHIAAMRARGRSVYQAGQHGQGGQGGQGGSAHASFVAPTLIEIEHMGELQREVFGPVLHLLRYARKDLDRLLAQINATGYGLTLGVHSRIDETIARVCAHARAGNLYVNRNMVGAVVGVQPFGGQGLSGTGPKAGGPLYLLRLLAHCPEHALAQALAASTGTGTAPANGSGAGPGQAPAPGRPTGAAQQPGPAALAALEHWARSTGRQRLAAHCQRFANASLAGSARALPGPTGESNVYTLSARSPVLCIANAPDDWLTQLAAVLACGASALWPPSQSATRAALPAAVQAQIRLLDHAIYRASGAGADSAGADNAEAAHSGAPDDPDEPAAVLHHGDSTALRALCQTLARRPGPIVALIALPNGASDVPLERLLSEQALSVNTAAAGGNASLMGVG